MSEIDFSYFHKPSDEFYEKLRGSKTQIEDLDSPHHVYFLFKGDRIVYVGQSKNILGRIHTHISEGRKQFDSYTAVKVPDAESACNFEAMYIYVETPIYNLTVPKNSWILNAKDVKKRLYAEAPELRLKIAGNGFNRGLQRLGIKGSLIGATPYFFHSYVSGAMRRFL